MRIGPYSLTGKVLLAPMAGVTDQPFRRLCRRFGAALAPSEMVAANPALRTSRKTLLRLAHAGDIGPIAVQIAGADPAWLADAARRNVDAGAQIIDINMGCPARKVCSVYAGSALLQDEALVGRILDRVIGAVDVPVTLKMRTGWSPAHRNGVVIARIAAAAGVAAIVVHGRTRACGYHGPAEYESIAAIKAAVSVPVVANGDIATPAGARAVLDATGADAVMIGRAAQGNPWIFRATDAFLARGHVDPEPDAEEFRATVLEHLQALYAFYGEPHGVRIARKHLAWYLKPRAGGGEAWQRINRIDNAPAQYALAHAVLQTMSPGVRAA
ncbi:MAG: tRNA dihydrouridine synthase DusB [Gammaproteobacteria bacterium]|nr:tRNA dihydrouridine synthase DusB [Gammaproteobacteria bacterium]